MIASLALLGAAVAAAPLPTKWAQVGPAPRPAAVVRRSPGRDRAVVLVQGLRPHPFSSRNVARPDWHGWQKPGSRLVRALSPDADVFAFAYAQTGAVDQVAQSAGLADAVRRLRQAGYQEVVLVGYSAGGVVARHFVEDHPGAGVTKVVQVCAPNGGCGWGDLPLVRKPQRAFLRSLSKSGRQECLSERADKTVPASVEFVCLVGHLDVAVKVAAAVEFGEGQVVSVAVSGSGRGDGLVSTDSQWPADLQEQGVPALLLAVSHFGAVRGKAGAQAVARLVREKQPRWNAAQVAEARGRLTGEGDTRP
jgi:pimeloyl-ACP methyl ester carboxylesterase